MLEESSPRNFPLLGGDIPNGDPGLAAPQVGDPGDQVDTSVPQGTLVTYAPRGPPCRGHSQLVAELIFTKYIPLDKLERFKFKYLQLKFDSSLE